METLQELATLGSDFWTMVSALATVVAAATSIVTLVIVAITAVLVTQQVGEARRARTQEIFRRFLDEVDSPEVRRARHRILNADLPPPEAMYDDSGDGRFRVRRHYQELHDDMRTVWMSYDNVGLLADRELMPYEDVRDFMPSISDCWLSLRPFIERERALRRNKNWNHYFQRLALQMLEDEARRAVPGKTTWPIARLTKPLSRLRDKAPR